jgi:hypothetical protein
MYQKKSGEHLINARKKMRKALPVSRMGFVIIQTGFNGCHYLVMGMKARHFRGQPGMPAQPSPQQNAESGLNRFKGSARADMNTLAASLA